MNDLELLKGQWETVLISEMRMVRREVIVSSPYVTSDGISALTDKSLDRGFQTPRLHFLTNLSPLNQITGVTDPHSLARLTEWFDETKIYHLRSLHAKVFVFDGKRAIVTSGNLTHGGLKTNQEYGVLISDARTAEEIRNDILVYAELGVEVSQSQLTTYCAAAEEASQAYKRQLASASSTARRAFVESLRAAEDQLIGLRLSQEPIHTVFEHTARYFFLREKALTTEELHHRIQSVHPDLCDDTVDRVIHGQRFGKRWKHAVRTVQQKLKNKGLIVNDNGIWRLVE